MLKLAVDINLDLANPNVKDGITVHFGMAENYSLAFYKGKLAYLQHWHLRATELEDIGSLKS